MRIIYVCSTSDNGTVEKHFLRKSFNTSAADPPKMDESFPPGCLVEKYGELGQARVIRVICLEESLSIVLGMDHSFRELAKYFTPDQGWHNDPGPRE